MSKERHFVVQINFKETGNSHEFIANGWFGPEWSGRWSGTESRLKIPAAKQRLGYDCTFFLTPFISPPILPAQLLVISAGDTELFCDVLSHGGPIEFTMDEAVFGEAPFVELILRCPQAQSPAETGSGDDQRRLGMLVDTLRLIPRTSQADAPPPHPAAKPAFSEHAPADSATASSATATSATAASATAGSATAKVCAVTMVYNESEYLPIWLRHYARQVGIENCFVIDHGSEDGSTSNLGACNVIRIPRSPYDPHKQSEFNSGFCSSLLAWYDWVIYSDVDEIILADPKIADTLIEYCSRDLPPVVTAIGLNAIHRPQDQPELDPSMPIAAQRPFVFFCSSMCKPALTRIPIVWSPGSHSANAPTVFDHLYMFHLRWYDLNSALRRLRRTRSMSWARSDAGGHQRVADAEMVASFQAFANLVPIVDIDFDPTQTPIREALDKVRASLIGREDQLYKIDLDIWPNRMWLIPPRFVGQF